MQIGGDILDVAEFTQSTVDLVFLDHLRCDGDEAKLVDCSPLYFLSQCSHEDSVAVRCNGTFV